MTATPLNLAQQDPTANQLRAWGDDLTKAKALVDSLQIILERLDKTGAMLTDAGVILTYSLGPIGDAAAAARRDLNADHIFDRKPR